MTTFEHWSLVWSAATAISTAATALVLASAAAFALSQFREAVRARALQSAMAVVEHVNGPHLRNARRLIYTEHDRIAKKLADDPTWEELDGFFKEISGGHVDLSGFHTYMAELENVAMLVLHDLVPDDLILMYFGRMAPYHWHYAGPFIRFMRVRYSSDDFLQHFEMLVKLIQQNGLRLQGVLRPSLPKRLWNSIWDPSHRKKRAMLLERYRRRRSVDEAFLAGLQYYHTERS